MIKRGFIKHSFEDHRKYYLILSKSNISFITYIGFRVCRLLNETISELFNESEETEK